MQRDNVLEIGFGDHPACNKNEILLKLSVM